MAAWRTRAALVVVWPTRASMRAVPTPALNDGGIAPGPLMPGAVTIVAVDEADTLLAWDPLTGSFQRARPQGDGGFAVSSFGLDPGERTLVTAGGATFAGSSQLLHTLAD